MPDERALLVSVKPVYVEMLLDGTKTVELRRVRPHVGSGCMVLIYASSPRMEMVGTARVESIEVGAVNAIWSRHASAMGIDRDTYSAYFDGAHRAVAITFRDVRRLRAGVPLAELRRRIAGFRPPQSFRYLGTSDTAAAT